MQVKKITPFLWFDNNAEEAMNFYVSIFKNSKVLGVTRNPKDGPGPEGTVLTVKFVLDGEEFIGLNGGPSFKFSEAISFWIKCDTQEEIDYFWEKLSDGGEKRECGWLSDKFGLCWQTVPTVLEELIAPDDPARAARVFKAVWQMQKIDIAQILKAAKG